MALILPRRTLAILSAALLPLAAQAASFTYSGTGASGTDPASSDWTFGNNGFGFYTFVEPLQNNEFPTFKGAPGLDHATSLLFTYTGTDPDGFNMLLGSGVTHVASPQGATWDTTYLSDTQVLFTAEGTDRLDIGDTFSIQVAFDHAIDPANFGFTMTWSDAALAAPAPEPASWAMMVGGFGLAGGALRTRRRKAAVRFA